MNASVASRSPRPLAAIALLLALSAAAPLAADISWRSYAEIGPGCAFIGAGPKAMMQVETGIILGRFELGARTAAIPLEYGSPDLVQVGAARWGATFGFRPSLDLAVQPFARLGLGRVGTGRVPEGGKGDMEDFTKEFDLSLQLGAALPLGGRWSALAWGAYDYAPGAEDYEGESLSGLSFGLALRMTWETTLR
jgi:hypothetical protein